MSGPQRRRMTSLLVLLILFLHGGFAFAASETELMKVRMEGEAAGGGPEARAAATQSAERRIVFQVLQAALATDNLNLLTSISDNAARYIQSTQLVRYDITDGKTHVEIESYVRRAALLKDAAAAMVPQLASAPRALVIVGEKHGPDAPFTAAKPGAAETCLSEALKAAKFDVVDSQVARDCYTEKELVERIQSEGAGELAQQGFADVTVIGAADIGLTLAGNIYAAQAKVSARVFRGIDGKMIEAVSGEAVVHGAKPEEGMEAALQDACEKIKNDITLYATLAMASPVATDEIVVSVENPGTRERFGEILAAAQRVCGGKVKEFFFSPGLARFHGKYDGPVSAFVDAMVKPAYKGFVLDVHQAVQKTIALRVVEPLPEK